MFVYIFALIYQNIYTHIRTLSKRMGVVILELFACSDFSLEHSNFAVGIGISSFLQTSLSPPPVSSMIRPEEDVPLGIKGWGWLESVTNSYAVKC